MVRPARPCLDVVALDDLVRSSAFSECLATSLVSLSEICATIVACATVVRPSGFLGGLMCSSASFEVVARLCLPLGRLSVFFFASIGVLARPHFLACLRVRTFIGVPEGVGHLQEEMCLWNDWYVFCVLGVWSFFFVWWMHLLVHVAPITGLGVGICAASCVL